MSLTAVLVQPAVLCTDIRLRMEVLVQDPEVMVETLMSAGSQAGDQQSGHGEEPGMFSSLGSVMAHLFIVLLLSLSIKLFSQANTFAKMISLERASVVEL